MIPTPDTARRFRWSVMLVALPDETAARCERILAPLVMVRVVDVSQALERLSGVQPVLVCVPHSAETTLLRERASDVGAAFVVIPDRCEGPELERLLRRSLAE